MSTALLAVYTTLPTVDAARDLAREMVTRQLAACVQIEAIESFYSWDKALQQDTEWRVMFKTTTARYAELETAIRERHPYELPAIHAVAVTHVYGPYKDWVMANTTKA